MTSDLIIRVRGLGHVPAFKNKKIIAGKRLITAPKARKWMEQARSSIISSLKSLCQTRGVETSTGHWQQYAMSLLPADDNWKALPKITVVAKTVPNGEEGALIKLTRLK